MNRNNINAKLHGNAVSTKENALASLASAFSLFPCHQISIKGYALRSGTRPRNVVVFGNTVVKVSNERLTYSRTFLINAIEQRIRDVGNTLFVLLTRPYRIERKIDFKEFVVIVGQFFKKDAFRMPQKQKIHSLGQRRHLDFLMIVG